MDYQRIRYENPAPGVARITLARDEVRNAQDRRMIYEIDDALQRVGADNTVKAVIIAADGPHFSSGHDLDDAYDQNNDEFRRVTLWGGFDEPGLGWHMNLEEDVFLGMARRWRDFPKPTLVAVQGACIAGGLMLVWPFDIVIAADDATFSDPVVAFGTNGVEYFAHVWELGHRKAKEFLFTGAALSAEECRRIGMVNHVVPRADLAEFTLKMAQRIATRPIMGLRLAKLSVNQSLDAQGQWTAIQAAFSLHHIGHAQARLLHGLPVDPAGVDVIRREAKQPPSS
ncbi:MAG: enoyl-CoA hydratase [Sinimarinibacterium sp.]|jgi:enoyl-CoA hydratase